MRKLRSSTRGATELHLLDAHPTAYIGVIDLTPANEIDNFIPFLQSHAQHLTCERAYSGYEIGLHAVQILNGEYDHLIGQYKDSEKP